MEILLFIWSLRFGSGARKPIVWSSPKRYVAHPAVMPFFNQGSFVCLYACMYVCRYACILDQAFTCM